MTESDGVINDFQRGLVEMLNIAQVFKACGLQDDVTTHGVTIEQL